MSDNPQPPESDDDEPDETGPENQDDTPEEEDIRQIISDVQEQFEQPSGETQTQSDDPRLSDEPPFIFSSSRKWSNPSAYIETLKPSDEEMEKSQVSKIYRLGIRFLGYGVILVLSARLIHLVLPSIDSPWCVRGWCLRQWMTDKQIQDIDKFFFSGALGGALSGFMKSKFNRK